MINNLLYLILLYIFIILTIKKLNIKFINDNKLLINITNNDFFIKDMINIDLTNYNIIDNKFDLLIIIRLILMIYYGNKNDKHIIYNYFYVYIINIIIELIILITLNETNIIINPIIMTIGYIIGNLMKKQDYKKYDDYKMDNDIIYENLII